MSGQSKVGRCKLSVTSRQNMADAQETRCLLLTGQLVDSELKLRALEDERVHICGSFVTPPRAQSARGRWQANGR